MSLRPKLPSKPEDFHLKIAPEYVELLNLLPDFRELSTEQLRHKLPKKYREIAPPPSAFTRSGGGDDSATRAAIIGMLATPDQIDSFIGMQFIERSFVLER